MLSVVIPTYRRNDLLKICLDKLSPEFQSLDANKYEIIVTDDSENYDAKALIESNGYDWVRWIEGPHNGPASNRNNGAKQASGSWIVFIDDDCIPNKNLLEVYHKSIIELPHIGAFEGKIEADRDRCRYDEEAPINLTGGYFWSCNIAVNKEIFHKLKGFDEEFPFAAMEDIDFHKRLLKICETQFLENASVVHPYRRVLPNGQSKKGYLSYLYYKNKHELNSTFNYRVERVKNFLLSFKNDLKMLLKYRLKGKRVFMERMWYKFLLIFN